MDNQVGLLSDDEIKALGLVQGGEEQFYRASTYDLSVGDIIPAGGKPSTSSEFSLPAGGMVRVVSKELLKLPNTVTGHVLLKNRLCTVGVLALSIGVVDPGFEGPISSTLINFGREEYVLEKGTSFLRVSFLRCPESPKAKASDKFGRDNYTKIARQSVRDHSGPMFLNLDVVTANAAEKAFGKFREGLFLWATVATVLIALLAIFAPLGASFVDKHLVSDQQRDVRLEQSIEKDVEARYEKRIEDLSNQVEQLRQNSAKVKGKNATANEQ
jgi:deoxycytidine triphosphate deaminase